MVTGIIVNDRGFVSTQRRPIPGDGGIISEKPIKIPGAIYLNKTPNIDEFVPQKPKNTEKVKTPNVEIPKSKTGKKLGVTLATCLYSGLGQAVNGQWGKALGFCLGESAAMIAGFCVGGPIGAGLAALVVRGLAIRDAVKNV